ncbi:unnamed protein product [Adineta ricciae]|uniref:Uncharacterized protein n=1 Tax=Adineta ricciae TaxID=249248 RepID=A0A815Q3D9_ADIRI|nr:unnamed protein product [Adineta ricciae]CAF1458232.1 unnamed protein product [Adineta ricciae]
MKSKSIFTMFMQCVLFVLGDKWDQYNDPSTWNPSFRYELDKLPMSGKSGKIPWSDTYWPSYRGGIANRWQDEKNSYPGFDYKLYTLEELKNGSVDLNVLSPAEKFDIFNSRYDYPLLNSEWHRCNPNDARWEGICHGWAPAAIHYEEPKNVTMKNKEGLEISFGSSDVKALLSYFLAQFASDHEKTQFIAERCNTDISSTPQKADSSECRDINPGTFHVMLTNIIGFMGTAFVGDVERSSEVWNQPITKYEYILGNTSSPTNTSAPGTVKQQSVSLTMYYVKETRPLPTAHEPQIVDKNYNYLLDLDADGSILGGSYDESQWERVDFMWAQEEPAFFGYFEQLDKIYKASIGGNERRRLISHRPRVSLNDYHATTVTTGGISLSSYNASTRRSWLVPVDANNSVRLRFRSFNTRRFTDYVRVFEVENGHIGAPIAVLHGSSLPKDIVLRPGVSVLVTFSVDQKAAHRMSLAKGTGFELFVL